MPRTAMHNMFSTPQQILLASTGKNYFVDQQLDESFRAAARIKSNNIRLAKDMPKMRTHQVLRLHFAPSFKISSCPQNVVVHTSLGRACERRGCAVTDNEGRDRDDTEWCPSANERLPPKHYLFTREFMTLGNHELRLRESIVGVFSGPW